MQTTVVSFGYKHGLPLDVDLVFDCRFLPNPHWVEELRPLTGLDDAGARLRARPAERTAPFLEQLDDLLGLLLPAYVEEGKSYLSIAFGCTGGRHRSVVIAEELAPAAGARAIQPRVTHRDIGQAVTAATRADPGRASSPSAAATAWRRPPGRAATPDRHHGGRLGRRRRRVERPAPRATRHARPGDLRRCLVALADADVAARPQAFEHRFTAGELDGHALGNLVIAGLAEPRATSSPPSTRSAGCVGAAGGCCRPHGPVTLKADAGGSDGVEGQVAVPNPAGHPSPAVAPAVAAHARRGRARPSPPPTRS